MRILGYAVIERARKRHNSRMLSLRFVDANTKFFHRKASSRRRKNFIQRLKVGNGWALSHEGKAQEIQNFFQNAMKQPPPRNVDLNWEIISNRQHNLSSLDTPFSEVEIIGSIDLLPADKAPGPDGFTGSFLKSCWATIKYDFMAAVNAFYNLRCCNLHLINSASIILIPKKDGAETVGDFRPISLIHSFIKIITKTLALRLAPRMNEIISPFQSAFIKSRSIHENFLAVRSTIRRFQRNNSPTLFIKLDIAKAFDSVRWDYLISLLDSLGFPVRWIDWIATILYTSSSRVTVNGVPNPPIRHGRDLRQGDPLSPLLFVLAIDPLQKILKIAAESGALSKLGNRSPILRISLYADDTALFVKPKKRKLRQLSVC
jgi:hypothetical protein